MKTVIIMFGITGLSLKATLERWHFLPVERLIHYSKEWSLEETIAMTFFICLMAYPKRISLTSPRASLKCTITNSPKLLVYV